MSTINLALVALHLLVGIIASRSAALGGLHALAVAHGGGVRGLPPDPLPVDHDQQMVDGLEQTRVPPQVEPAKDRALGRQIRRQQPPGDTTAQRVRNCAQDLPGGPAAQATSGLRLGPERLDQRPFGIGQIGFVAQAVAAILPPSGRDLHCASKLGFSTLPKSSWSQTLNPV